MSGVTTPEPQVLHAVPGRLRVHLPGWSGGGAHLIERRLRRLPGVRRAEANPLTGNVLAVFDARAVSRESVLAALRVADGEPPGPQAEAPSLPPAVEEEAGGGVRRARIAVRGLDRDPRLVRRVLDRLRRHLGVRRAQVSPLTGRVLVEYDGHETELTDLLCEVAGVELAPLPGEDRPAHPLDPGPLYQSVTRTVGTALGLGFLAARRLLGATARPRGARAAATAAGFLGLLRSFPAVRNGLRKLLGRDLTDAAFSTASIVTLTASGGYIGLVLLGAEAAVLLREVLARRAAWRRYEAHLGDAAHAEPGAVIRLEPGERSPFAARVVEGAGTAIGADGLPFPITPESRVPAGALLSGGPFVMELEGGPEFVPEPRPAPLAPSFYRRYVGALGPAALGYAALTALLTRSPARAFHALLLVNPRTAIIGVEAANLNAASRVLRAGVTVVGTRLERSLRLPDVLLLDGPRVLTDGLELAGVLPLDEGVDVARVQALAGGVSVAAGSPWGHVFPRAGLAEAGGGSFNGMWAEAVVDGVRYTLGPPEDLPEGAEAFQMHHQGGYLLLLTLEGSLQPLGLLALRPKLSPGAGELVRTCQRLGVKVAILPGRAPAAAEVVARRVGLRVVPSSDAVAVIRERQTAGRLVAFLSDSARAAPAFAACDLAIGLAPGHGGRFPARADLLAPDLGSVAAILEAGQRRQAAVRDGVVLSALANVFGGVWGLRTQPGVLRASLGVYVSALAALADGTARLAGGRRPGAALASLVDPRPERWGRRSVPGALRALRTTADGLSAREAARRKRQAPRQAHRHELWAALVEQLRYPTTGILAGAAGFSLLAGSPLDAGVIGATIAVNVAVGVWQERQAGRAAEALNRLGTATARVLRDGRPVTLPAPEVVTGDVLLLAPGDRVAADARVIDAQDLEVDEAALTGESLPVPKAADGGPAEHHVVLEGSDVVVGTARAVVVATGRQTRFGAMAAVLEVEEREHSPLGARLSRLLWQSLPLTAAASAVVVGSGLLRGRPLLGQLAVGGSLALAAVPEGLPLLAGMGQAGVARRLARRNALVRRLSAVEALGRVDVACTDKTGTLTQGRLAVSLIVAGDGEVRWPGAAGEDARRVLLTAALASPHPDAADAAAHPTDVAVVRAAEGAGLGAELRRERQDEAPFAPQHSFHAAVVRGRLCVKGAPEALVPRCARLRLGGGEVPLDDAGREALGARARDYAARGLRLLLVAEGPAGGVADDPQGLTALGFVGISDPLRPAVPAAVRRCHAAGVRVLMITGDHPATARSIAREAGLEVPADGVVTGAELGELDDAELGRRLERATVVARATPLDKLRIIEGLQRLGHTVAMTGDGVNDAPALRLADVGVAMGHGGTEVARQAAGVVLADDDFATLVEALVEGRGFWRNMRRSLALLLGGNLGELAVIAGASVVGFASPLNSRQILVVNLITDALPALAVVLQRPEHRNLAGLAREGVSALDVSLRGDVLRRGAATALPALAAYLLARGPAGPAAAGTAAYGSVVANQLAQTLDAGWAEGRLSGPVAGAVAGSAGLLAATLLLPPVRNVLGLALPGPLGWSLLGASAAASVLVNRLLLPDGVTRPQPAAAAGNGAPGRSGVARLLPGSLLARLRAFPGPA
jgi:calcium-translocating P-type ATPase